MISFISPIMTLLLWGCPSKIAWLVIAIIVYSVNPSATKVSRFDIFTKILKRFSPTLTNFDTSRAIVFEGRTFRIFTTANHCRPPAIEKMVIAMSTFCVSMRYRAFSRCFDSQTPATFCITSFNRAGSGNNLVSAITEKEPFPMTIETLMARFDCGQSPKSFARFYPQWSRHLVKQLALIPEYV